MLKFYTSPTINIVFFPRPLKRKAVFPLAVHLLIPIDQLVLWMRVPHSFSDIRGSGRRGLKNRLQTRGAMLPRNGEFFLFSPPQFGNNRILAKFERVYVFFLFIVQNEFV